MFRTICSALLVVTVFLGMALNPAIAREEEEEELQALTFLGALKGPFQAKLRAEKAHKQAELQLRCRSQASPAFEGRLSFAYFFCDETSRPPEAGLWVSRQTLRTSNSRSPEKQRPRDITSRGRLNCTMF